MSNFLSDSFTTPPPGSAQQPQLHFGSTFTTSLASTLGAIPATPSDSTPAGGLGTLNHNGKIMFLIQDVDNICKGRIGSSSKVCCKPSNECAKTRHKNNVVEDLKPGYYRKAGDFEIYSDVMAPSHMVDEDLGKMLLSDGFKSKDVGAVFQILNQQSQPKELNYQDLCDKMIMLSEGLDLKTPAVKRRKSEEVETQFKQVLQSWNEKDVKSESSSQDNPVTKEKLLDFCNLTASALMKDEAAIRALSQQLEFVRSLIGNEHNSTSYT